MEQQFSTLSANIAQAKYRVEQLNGREHWAVPVSLLVPGVLPGSEGPLFYPLNEVKKSTRQWNNIPLVVEHPIAENGKHVSARDPDVLNRQGVGVIMRAKTDDRLRAEAWFDVEKTRQVDNTILSAIASGTKLEVSTGLFTENDRVAPGASHKGRPYHSVAKNYMADHVAILRNGQKGACCVEDGCGVFNSQMSYRSIQEKIEGQLRQSPPIEQSLAVSNPWVVEVFDDHFIVEKDGKLYSQKYMLSGEDVEVSKDAFVEVERITEYRPVQNVATADDTTAVDNYRERRSATPSDVKDGNKLTWDSWRGMMNRPLSDPYYKGVSIDKRWHDFENFLQDMGKRPSRDHQISRKDNSKGYSKGNCEWTTKAENIAERNRRQAKNSVTNATKQEEGEETVPPEPNANEMRKPGCWANPGGEGCAMSSEGKSRSANAGTEDEEQTGPARKKKGAKVPKETSNVTGNKMPSSKLIRYEMESPAGKKFPKSKRMSNK